MKNLLKFYFKDIDDTFCVSLEDHIHDAKIEGLSEITLIEAIPDKDNKDFIWCTHFAECGERSFCKKSVCDSYSSKSGRGKCKHRGNLYEHGEEVKFNVE